MSRERPLNLDQWETFSENYKPVRVWLSFVYKNAVSFCYKISATLRQVHSDSEDISYLQENFFSNLEITFHIKPKFFMWINLPENFLSVR